MMRSGVMISCFMCISRLIVTKFTVPDLFRWCGQSPRSWRAVLLDRFGKLRWRAHTHDRSDAGDPRGDCGIDSDGTDIGGDAILEISRHSAPAEKADDALEHECWVSHFLGSRDVRRQRGALAIGHHQYAG